MRPPSARERASSGRMIAMSGINVTLSDEMLAALKLPPEQAAAEFRLAAAMKLYEMGRLSSGAAAHLAGIPRVVFLTRLAEFGIDTFTLSGEDLDRETRFA